MKKLSISMFVVFITLFGLFAIAKPASAMTCTSATFTGTVITGTPPTHARFKVKIHVKINNKYLFLFIFFNFSSL